MAAHVRGQLTAPPALPRQGGFTLVEALFAVLVFSLGVLALIGFQASAVKASSDARARSDATLIANKVISDIWANLGTPCSPNTLATILTNTAITNQWSTMATQLLPGGITPNPVVVSDAVTPSELKVTVYWQQPGDSTQHNVYLSAQISANPPPGKCS